MIFYSPYLSIHPTLDRVHLRSSFNTLGGESSQMFTLTGVVDQGWCGVDHLTWRSVATTLSRRSNWRGRIIRPVSLREGRSPTRSTCCRRMTWRRFITWGVFYEWIIFRYDIETLVGALFVRNSKAIFSDYWLECSVNGLLCLNLPASLLYETILILDGLTSDKSGPVISNLDKIIGLSIWPKTIHMSFCWNSTPYWLCHPACQILLSSALSLILKCYLQSF